MTSLRVPSRSAALLLALAAAALPAQAPPGGPSPVVRDGFEVAADDARAAQPLQLGRDVLADGRPREAVPHLLEAWSRAPGSTVVLTELCRAAEAAGDADARALFALHLLSAAADERGRNDLERAQRQVLPRRDPWPAKLAEARAEAIAELGRWAGRLNTREVGSGLLARWAAGLAAEIGRDMPRALAAVADDLDAAVAACEPDRDLVIRALRGLLTPRLPTSAGDEAVDRRQRIDARQVAVDAARILRGLAAQAGFDDDLYGPPPPDLGDVPGEAQRALQRLRDDALQDVGEPWTVDRLEALPPLERRRFTAEHDSWALPGVAVSPDGRYLIETVCGFDTLLAAASTVEHHHDRLANWYGKDPFASRQGILRIEPEHTGLEARGAPFWWAGGFQSGDTTTIRVAWTNREAMGRALTHELTHRFDGVLCPFQPSWLVEGKAVWTARSYAAIESEGFVEDYLPPGSMAGVFVDGYGSVDKLTELIEGTIDDYRDNYSAGSALYTYLKLWRETDGGPSLFAARLQDFTSNARAGRRDPLAYFVDHFADGVDGRPADLEAFAEGFREFLRQCYRYSWGDKDEDNAWIEARYKTHFERERGSGLLEDRPTWSWARSRAEPWFGQGHAAEAGRLLADAGETDAAVAAWCWSLQVDGWNAEALQALARLLPAVGEREAAAAAVLLGRQRFPGAFPDATEQSPLLRRLGRLRGLLAEYAEAAAAWREQGLEFAAAWVLQAHDDLTPWTGTARRAAAAVPDGPCLQPRHALPRPLGTAGWTEDGLTGYEERRREGLWFETAPGGDLHVGRERPRDDTGVEDRRAHQRHAYVRSVRWLEPGRYVVRARIHFTTSFVNGAVIVGTQRRDRNVRLGFRAGDFRYAIGRKDDDGKKKAVHLSVNGLYEREGPLAGSRPGTTLEFDRPSSFVDLELHVDGPTLRVIAMGEERFSYTTPTGAPIEGAVGFAMSQGAIRVQSPTVQRRDRRNLAPFGAGDGARNFADLVRERADGFPRNPDGTLVLWIPSDEDIDWIAKESGRVFRRMSLPMRDQGRFPQPWIVMVPPEMTAEQRERIAAAAREVVGEDLQMTEHLPGAPDDDDFWVLFIDGFGVLRAAGMPEASLPPTVRSWALYYRRPR